MQSTLKKIRLYFKKLGPGLITGAADDDPSGIATYSQTGAQFGFGLLWTAIFMLPLMTAVQEACARIGAVTGKGIAAVVKENYSKKILYSVVMLVLVANTINIGADIGAMAAAARLIIPLPFVSLTLLFSAGILILEIFTSYKSYARILKWLALALLAYPLTAIIAHGNLGVLLKSTFIPHFEFSFGFLFIVVGVLGTTISPYLFFWEASEEVEEEKVEGIGKIDGKPSIGKKFIKSMRVDNAFGMIASELTTWSIIVVAASVLNLNGVTNIQNSAQAAAALEPLVKTFPNAGFIAQLIFAVGIIGLGLLAVPVLSGSAAYALAEAFNWKVGLNYKIQKAHGFYGVITVATLIGLLINFIGINPVQALVVTAVINGLVAVPLIFLLLKIGNNEKIMGKYKSGKFSNAFVVITFLAMTAAAVGLLLTLLGIVK